MATQPGDQHTKPFWQLVYDSLATIQRDDWSFMNYGYAPATGEAAFLDLDESEERNRYPIQLYHHVAAAVPIGGKDVLEVGSGRGGGALYIATHLDVRSITGVDLSANAVKFCRRLYDVPNLRFTSGDAEDLPFADETIDVVLNVESSHCYSDFRRFIGEVRRVLKPSGFLSICDVRYRASQVADVRDVFRRSGLAILSETDISQNVIRALDQVSPSKERLIDELNDVPLVLRKSLKNFAGVRDGRNYRAIRDGKYPYLHWVLRKRPAITAN